MSDINAQPTFQAALIPRHYSLRPNFPIIRQPENSFRANNHASRPSPNPKTHRQHRAKAGKATHPQRMGFSPTPAAALRRRNPNHADCRRAHWRDVPSGRRSGAARSPVQAAQTAHRPHPRQRRRATQPALHPFLPQPTAAACQRAARARAGRNQTGLLRRRDDTSQNQIARKKRTGANAYPCLPYHQRLNPAHAAQSHRRRAATFRPARNPARKRAAPIPTAHARRQPAPAAQPAARHPPRANQQRRVARMAAAQI